MQLDVELQQLLREELRLSGNVVLLWGMQSLLFVLLSTLFELLLVLPAVRLCQLLLLHLLPQHVWVLLTLPVDYRVAGRSLHTESSRRGSN